MASSLSQLLLNHSRTTNIATRKALLVLDLQNDLVQEDGKLPVILCAGFQKYLVNLAVAFRHSSSEVVWVRTEFDCPQPVNEGAGNGPIIIHADPFAANGKASDSDEDSEEEMLRSALEGKRASWGTRPSAARMAAAIRRSSSRSSNHQPTSSRDAFLSKAEGLNTCCLPNTYGSMLCSLAQQALDPFKDLQIVKTTYSAFDSESIHLLTFLRSRLVTELYLCGSLTNISVYATASDAVRHGFEVYVIDDCLGYRNVSAHDEALSRMVDVMGVLRISAEECLVQLGGGVAAGSHPPTASPPLLNTTSVTGNGVVNNKTRSSGILEIDTSSKPTASPASKTAVFAKSPNGTSAEHHDLHRRLSREMRKRSTASLASIVPTLVEECSEETPKQEALRSEKEIDILPDVNTSVPLVDPPLVAEFARETPKQEHLEQKTDNLPDITTSGLLTYATLIEEVSTRMQENCSPEETSDNHPDINTSALLVAATLAGPEEATKEDKPREPQPDPPSTPLESRTSNATPNTVPPFQPDTEIPTHPADSSSNSHPTTAVSACDAKATDSCDEKILSHFPPSNLDGTTSANISGVIHSHVNGDLTSEHQSETISSPSSIRAEEQISDMAQQGVPLPSNGVDGQDVVIHPPQEIRQTTDQTRKLPTRGKAVSHPVLGANDHIGEGDSRIFYDAITSNNPDIFTTLKNEIHWQKMSHAQGEVPRLVCAQGIIDSGDGSMPVYRHPADHSLPLLHFSRTVRKIKDQVQKIVGHPMNHVLIQLYRGGQDNISEHSDKTLDIVRGSSIVNVSLGAQRTMRLRTKKSAASQSGAAEVGRKTQLVPMPHGSVFVLGPQTNMAWLHGINADKRPAFERLAEELAFSGERISLTFRHIGTFLDADSKLIWGQGACSKSKAEANPVVNGDLEATQKMINAFGYENQQTTFNWDQVYGHGFDVLHFTHSLSQSQESPLLFTSGNQLHDKQVESYLEELGIPYHISGVSRKDAGREYSPTLCFRDTDTLKSQVYGVVPTLIYLSQTYSRPAETPKPVLAEALRLMWEYCPNSRSEMNSLSDEHQNEAKSVLATVEDTLAEDGGRKFVAGTHFSTADCFFWPLVDHAFDVICPLGEAEEGGSAGGCTPASAFPLTTGYWEMISRRKTKEMNGNRDGAGLSVDTSEVGAS